MTTSLLRSPGLFPVFEPIFTVVCMIFILSLITSSPWVFFSRLWGPFHVHELQLVSPSLLLKCLSIPSILSLFCCFVRQF